MTPFDSANIASLRATKWIRPPSEISVVPSYMQEVYNWAYLNPRNVRLLDREIVVSTILWGNGHRLKQALLDEISPEDHILQTAHVYGSLIPDIAGRLNQSSQLEVIDVAPVQAGRCREKLLNYPEATVQVSDAATHKTTPKDLVSCFFLLHEIPGGYKHDVVNTVLDHVNEGGKAVFVDYHQPHWLHPLRPLMSVVFDLLEPFAKELCEHEISDFADDPGAFSWSKKTYFGGLYQKTVARRRSSSE